MCLLHSQKCAFCQLKMWACGNCMLCILMCHFALHHWLNWWLIFHCSVLLTFSLNSKGLLCFWSIWNVFLSWKHCWMDTWKFSMFEIFCHNHFLHLFYQFTIDKKNSGQMPVFWLSFWQKCAVLKLTFLKFFMKVHAFANDFANFLLFEFNKYVGGPEDQHT